MIFRTLRLFFFALLVCALHPNADARAQAAFDGAPEIGMRLITAVGGVGVDLKIPAGIEFTLPEHWHTYWRNPGVAGAPPSLNWDGSTNIAGTEILWPAPQRFSQQGLETFGYSGTFILPVTVTSAQPGEPISLKVAADLVVCSDICVPAHAEATLDIPAGQPSPTADMAAWRTARARVPSSLDLQSVTVTKAQMNRTPAIELTLNNPSGWQSPDVIIEGEGDPAFLKPAIDMNANTANFTIPFDNAADAAAQEGKLIKLTVIDARVSAEGTVTLAPPPALPAPEPQPQKSWWQLILIALVGGLILNLMPCVLPVLSLKLLSVVQHAGETKAQIRRGFIASALGIIVSFWLLAILTIILQKFGQSVSWGAQFQQPAFIVFLLIILLGFAANLFGWFEITLPAKLQNKLGKPAANGVPSAGHEFLTGMLATLLATPCTAPFVGTAVGFALSQGAVEVLGIFTALAFGLALPYLLIAALPILAQKLPRPGKWMLHLRIALGCALLGTALWLLTIVWAQAGLYSALALALAGAILIALLYKRLFIIAGIVALLMFAAPFALPRADTPEAETGTLAWHAFEPEKIPQLVASGKTVFVDLTASWCLTCHANKRFVIDSDDVTAALSAPNVYLMLGDWTQPNEQIAAFLRTYQRGGIPFNMVVGPNMTTGIILPELLTKSAVIEALDKAK